MCIINCPLKIYIYYTQLIHSSAETHRLLKFLFRIMGRLVPAHNECRTFDCFMIAKPVFVLHLRLSNRFNKSRSICSLWLFICVINSSNELLPLRLYNCIKRISPCFLYDFRFSIYFSTFVAFLWKRCFSLLDFV